MNYYYAYEKLPVTGEYYFVGENTGDGFTGGYGSIFDEGKLDRLYIIKGAAGTGKSTFMRTLADACEQKGHSVVRYLCGSDPDSLDSVLIDGRVAVADGTAPHVLEMKYPGAASELIDVTNFWDKRGLMRERDSITRLSEEKSRRFDNAYKSLKAIDMLKLNTQRDISNTFDYAKAEAFISRMIKGLGKPDGGNRVKRNIYAVSMKGNVRLSSFETEAETVLRVADHFGGAMIFMRLLSEKLSAAGFGTAVSNDPIGGGIRDILLPSKSILITVNDDPAPTKSINIKRFIDKDRLVPVKGNIRLALKCRELFEDDICAELKAAGESHFGLEKIYGRYMDFDSLSEYTELKKNEIFAYLSK